jgi:hypothetical protein
MNNNIILSKLIPSNKSPKKKTNKIIYKNNIYKKKYDPNLLKE